jgi:alpha-amylase/alpha-mannosidase (GH57 family)
MEKYVCIHGHFYQPPRENPWLEEIELQDSAYPYHDWNERIAQECYGPNAEARILDGQGRITALMNNYSKISFNFGPTLLAWMEKAKPYKYQSVIQADRLSLENFEGHGSAMAQVFNHMILPLGNAADKYTQIRWGIRDFEFRFGRKPEGMWLAETAVDNESLDIMAQQGLKFTILAPNQAHEIRPLEGGEWQDVSGSQIDPTRAYKIRLSSGREMALFFYDGPISRAIAFEGLLVNGEFLANRLMGAFSDERTWPQMVNIATDGESYGHHHRFGELALAYAIKHVEADPNAHLTNYSQFLAKHPPTHEVRIFENSSWSCVHGVERWKSNCGCNSGGHQGWNQEWRDPLRSALDWLRDAVKEPYEKTAKVFLKDPWEARNDYIEIVLNRDPEVVQAFLDRNATRELTSKDTVKFFKLMELQRHAMLMYTSCGWFFDELSGIETVQVIQYAGRVVQLATELFGNWFREPFLEHLEKAKSNIPEHSDGKTIYRKWVEPTMLDLARVGAHYAISSVFEDYGEETSISAYSANRKNYATSQAGRVKLALGEVEVTSNITTESEDFCFGVLHLGDHNINCGITSYIGELQYKSLVKEIMQPFQIADFAGTIRVLDKHFGLSSYSLMSLFRDERRKVLDLILQPTLEEAEAAYDTLYEHNAPLVRFLMGSRMSVPKLISASTGLIMNTRLQRVLAKEEFDIPAIEALLEEIRLAGVQLDNDALGYSFRLAMQKFAECLRETPENMECLEKLARAASLLHILPFEVDVWKVQNVCYRILTEFYPDNLKKAEKGDEQAIEWVELFKSIAEKLSLKLPEEE